jgi:hypothetical protein
MRHATYPPCRRRPAQGQLLDAGGEPQLSGPCGGAAPAAAAALAWHPQLPLLAAGWEDGARRRRAPAERPAKASARAGSSTSQHGVASPASLLLRHPKHRPHPRKRVAVGRGVAAGEQGRRHSQGCGRRGPGLERRRRAPRVGRRARQGGCRLGAHGRTRRVSRTGRGPFDQAAARASRPSSACGGSSQARRRGWRRRAALSTAASATAAVAAAAAPPP